MKKFVVMSGGFHPFHAGHASLYQQAKEAFPDATVLVCATNVQKDRPFPFSLKQKLAQLSGVPPKDFIEVSRQFTTEDPAVASRIGDPNKAVVIYVRSTKDRNEPPTPWRLGPDGKPPVGKKGKPLSDYLREYPGPDAKLDPVTKHAYMAYLPTVEFGPGITSASEIRNAWPKLNDKRKTALVMSLYPATQKNPKLAQNVVGMFDQVMGGQQGVAEGSLEEYGDTAKGQKMLTKVQKRAVDRVTSKKADTDPKYAKKNSDTANRAWDRMTDKDVAEGDKKPEPPEADYGPEYQAMVRRVGQKAKEQEKRRPVDINDLARRLAAVKLKDEK